MGVVRICTAVAFVALTKLTHSESDTLTAPRIPVKRSRRNSLPPISHAAARLRLVGGQF